MKRVVLAAFAVVALLAISVSTALAQWPTSCVELNDIIEAGLGNHENVGIYERVHGDQAEAACRREHERDGFLFGGRRYKTPSKAYPASYTQAFVERAIHRYNNDGRQATLDYYNSPQSVDGQWYVFIADADTMLAHAAVPALVGRSSTDIRGPDGFPINQQIAAVATEEGAWVDYTWVNPISGASETKHSWVVVHDDVLFGSGWYEPGPSKAKPAAYTQAFVRRAIDLYAGVGRDVTLDYYNTVESVDGPWYVFIVNVEDGLTIGHHNPKFRGRDPGLRVDVTGYFYGDDLLAADENGRWVNYVFLNPATGEQETKHTWAVRRDGLIFASGWYSPGKSDAAGYTQAFVSRALGRYDAEGREATIAYYNSVESVDGPWYAFIVNVEDGLTIGHHNPKFRGRDPSLRVDVTGYFYGDDLLAADEDGRWIDYVFLNPETGEQQTKHTWAIRHDGLIFASGWYE